MTQRELDQDPGEQVLRSCEAASGERPTACPWRAFADPYVSAVIRAHRWWKVGELTTRYGDRVPERIAWGVEVYDAALNAVQVHDMREDREQREMERREAELRNK